MDFIKEKLSIYNDYNVFNDYINKGIYDIIDYSDLGNDFVQKNYDLFINLIKNGKYVISFNSPFNIRNNYLFYIASFEFGNFKPLFFYKGDVHVFDEFFEVNKDLIDFSFFDNDFILKKVLNFNCGITNVYFELLNLKIKDGFIQLEDLEKHPYFNKIYCYIDDNNIKKLYGDKVFEFVNQYGRDILLNGIYKFIDSLSYEKLKKFYDVFEVKNGSVRNLHNLYKSLVDYNFLFKSNSEILNNHSFNYIRPDNKEFVDLLKVDVKKYLGNNYNGYLIDDLFDKYIGLFNSSDYNRFNLYSSLIKEICNVSYNLKRDEFIKEKCDFSNGFPFSLNVSSKMKRNINKRKLMSDMSINVAYDFNKLSLLKENLVTDNVIDEDFDINILFALLTDGVKGISLIDLEDIDKNYLVGKIKKYVSSLIDYEKLNCDISFDEYSKFPLNDDCFCVVSDIKNIVNSIDLKRFFDCVIDDENIYNLFKKYVYKNEILYFVSSLRSCDVSYCGDVCYAKYNLIQLVNNFDKVCYGGTKNIYSSVFEMLKMAKFVDNPLNKYERIFDVSNKWIISDPRPHNSFVSASERINECVDVYKKMLDRAYISVPICSLKQDGLTISNDNFYDESMLVTGEKLESCMRAGGSLDKLFRYTLTSPNGFNIVIKKNSELISRIAGVCFGNTIFLNELRVDVNNKYSNDYLYKLLKKYVLLLVKECTKNGHEIEQIYIPCGVQGTKDVKENIVNNEMFLDLKNGKYGFSMDYIDSAICLYGSVKPIRYSGRFYSIPRFKVLSGDNSIKRINMLRALYNDEWDYISDFDKCICGSNWYVYSLNGNVDSFISLGNLSIDNYNEYRNALDLINSKKI